jgi:hypothetical protein
MFTRRSVLGVLGSALLLLAALPTSAQEIVTTGPPPALRRNLDAFMKAFNSGNADQYEAMAKAVFTPGYFKRQTADERKKEYLKMHADLGAIQIGRVERNGPDAPLQAFVKGSVASGVLWIDLDDASRIDGIRAEVDKKVNADRRH